MQNRTTAAAAAARQVVAAAATTGGQWDDTTNCGGRSSRIGMARTVQEGGGRCGKQGRAAQAVHNMRRRQSWATTWCIMAVISFIPRRFSSQVFIIRPEYCVMDTSLTFSRTHCNRDHRKDPCQRTLATLAPPAPPSARSPRLAKPPRQTCILCARLLPRALGDSPLTPSLLRSNSGFSFAPAPPRRRSASHRVSSSFSPASAPRRRYQASCHI